MCNVCGCGEGETTIEGHHSHDHGHHHHHHHHDHGTHDYGKGPAHAHAPGMTQERMVEIEQNILAKNDQYAESNRDNLRAAGTLALNLVSSPGSGKTTLLTQTLRQLNGTASLGVIEGDQQTANDADRIRQTGVKAIQINTGKGCHLDAHMVGHAMEHLDVEEGILFIENVGNLVCPAGFDLGEAHKVVILSVTEGEDKPLKYPDMFHASDVMILTKTDLLPHLDFDTDKCIEMARRVNPDLKVMLVSAKNGDGMDEWLNWIDSARQPLLHRKAG